MPPYGQAPPLASLPPPDATAPQAAGPAAATYHDKSGAFLDLNGQIGVYAAGASSMHPAETWVDVMMDPRSR